jgi:signal peptidase I
VSEGAPPRPPRPWWLSRWAIGAAVLIALPVAALSVAASAGSLRSFYLPSEAMAPTLMKGDRLIASMKGPGDLHRGDVILFDGPHEPDIWVKRVAGLPGDRIEVRNGIVYLNGRAVAQRQVGVDRIEEPVMGVRQARRLAEQFPGEKRPHLIWDITYSPELDDFPETLVAPGHVFVLGDNRDQSADSRVSPERMGVDQLPIAKIRGKPLFHSLFSSKRIGERI